MVASTPPKPMSRDAEADAATIRRLRIELNELNRSAIGQRSGWVLVPKRATLEMLRAGHAHKKDGVPVEDIYDAMLAARPEVKND